MSVSRSRRYKSVRPSGTLSAPTPEPESPGFIRVVERGCGGAQDYWGESYCRHEYDWACDDCPIVHQRWHEHERDFIGPPVPADLPGYGYFTFDS